MRTLIVTTLLGIAVACSPSPSPTGDSELIEIARSGARAAEAASLRPLASNQSEAAQKFPDVVKQHGNNGGLRQLHVSERCDARKIYALSGDTEALRKRLLAAADAIREGAATASDREVRVLVEHGFDYTYTATIVDGTGSDPALLILDACDSN